MSTSAVNPTNSNTSTSPTLASAASTASLASENVFLQLLVAQLQYQDPDNPMDGTQFVTQLAQFSELSNTSDMASDLDAIKTALTTSAATTPAAAPTSQTNPANS